MNLDFNMETLRHILQWLIPLIIMGLIVWGVVVTFVWKAVCEWFVFCCSVIAIFLGSCLVGWCLGLIAHCLFEMFKWLYLK